VRYHLTILLSFFLAAVLASVNGFSQQSEQEKMFAIEAQKMSARQRLIPHQLDSTILLSDQGAYEKADEKFKVVLKNLKSIPSDFTFHFGKNSFHLGLYKQSIDWLNKYIQLKGTSGQYSEAAVDWLAKAETALLKEREVQARQAGAQVAARARHVQCARAERAVGANERREAVAQHLSRATRHFGDLRIGRDHRARRREKRLRRSECNRGAL